MSELPILRAGQVWTATSAPAGYADPDQATIRYVIAQDGAHIAYREMTHDGWSGKCTLTEAEFRTKYPVLRDPGPGADYYCPECGW